MNAHTDKSTQPESKSAASSILMKQGGVEPDLQILTKNSATVNQRKLQEAVDNSPNVLQMRIFQNIADHSDKPCRLPAGQNSIAVQRVASNNDVVQLKGYVLSDASDSMAIKEQEVGNGQTIKFTVFTSCIGIVGKNSDGTLRGIHLVRFGKDGVPFDMEDIAVVTSKLSGLSNSLIVGMTDFWEEELLNDIGGTISDKNPDGSKSITTNEAGNIIFS